ncbi:MAG TPA: hypothetical protein VGM18_14260 [Candidatus Sulfotelmatobacter sp.]|jgi:hypothetical protein
MKTHSIWIEIVVLGSTIAFVLALLIATLGAAAGALGPEAAAEITSQQVYVGMVSCSSCGARHSAAIGKTADVCIRVCVHGGSSFTLVDADMTYLLNGDSNLLKSLAGRRARVVGTLDNRTIKISSIAADI